MEFILYSPIFIFGDIHCILIMEYSRKIQKFEYTPPRRWLCVLFFCFQFFIVAVAAMF